ncbi:PREDICTED: ribonuclease 3-like [Theobroma cacao]|uniref:Ribonuclease 3-like n=1 Tax=Theobroma cacao TaxID=3641 RepID=A0AB32X2X2_THECC|nr:PREDICTED: ribonuclease 3-like [Theobroma cacao]
MKRHLLAVAVLATLLVSATSEFDFYKLSLMWPPSVCNTGMECIPKIPKMFTIHGLWPQYANDIPVPPYDEDPSCTNIIPTSSDEAMNDLVPIEEELTKYWPNLFIKDGKRDDQYFWRHEWEDHGMCSDYPDDPRSYFYDTFSLTTQHNPLEVMGIQPGDELNEVGTILEAVKQGLGAYPQIVCNILPRVKTLQLKEIRFCFERAKPPSVLKNCTNKLAGDCAQLTDLIRFPPPPTVAICNDEL